MEASLLEQKTAQYNSLIKRLGMLENDNDVFINTLMPTNRESGIIFGESGDSDAGSIRYRGSTATAPASVMSFYTANTRRMLIDGSGNIGIGTATPNASLTIAAGKTTIADEWTVRSNRNIKEDIKLAKLDTSKGLPNVYTYKIKYKEPILSGKGDKIIGYKDKLTEKKIGMMADEVPNTDEKSINLYEYISYLTAYIDNLEQRIETLESVK
jgi:hypothetical protein